VEPLGQGRIGLVDQPEERCVAGSAQVSGENNGAFRAESKHQADDHLASSKLLRG
jgi:hypothetical protein